MWCARPLLLQIFIQAELGSTASQGQPREKRAGAAEGRSVEGLSDWSLPCHQVLINDGGSRGKAR